MPELPEVETVRRGLEHWCVNSSVLDIDILHPRAVSDRTYAPVQEFQGESIKGISRRGKFLWFIADGSYALVAHLGMSGQFLVQKPEIFDERHLRARLILQSKSPLKKIFELRFIDQRTFGWLALSPYSGNVPLLVSKIAPDIFDPYFDRAAVMAKYRNRKIEIKKVLLDQNVMSGVGNIYADESLWRARINPQTLASSLSTRQIDSLLESVDVVMSQALVEGGTSFDSLYTNVNGESGYFENSLNVYGRENKPCPQCMGAIRRIIVGARSSHYCPRCQRN